MPSRTPQERTHEPVSGHGPHQGADHIRGGYATLDALLAALLFDRLEDVEAAHAAVPLANTNGIEQNIVARD